MEQWPLGIGAHSNTIPMAIRPANVLSCQHRRSPQETGGPSGPLYDACPRAIPFFECRGRNGPSTLWGTPTCLQGRVKHFPKWIPPWDLGVDIKSHIMTLGMPRVDVLPEGHPDHCTASYRWRWRWTQRDLGITPNLAAAQVLAWAGHGEWGNGRYVFMLNFCVWYGVGQVGEKGRGCFGTASANRGLAGRRQVYLYGWSARRSVWVAVIPVKTRLDPADVSLTWRGHRYNMAGFGWPVAYKELFSWDHTLGLFAACCWTSSRPPNNGLC